MGNLGEFLQGWGGILGVFFIYQIDVSIPTLSPKEETGPLMAW